MSVVFPSLKASWMMTDSMVAFTWDFTFSRPIQHCVRNTTERGWPFTHRLPLCGTTDYASPCRAAEQNTMDSTVHRGGRVVGIQLHVSLALLSLCAHISPILWIPVLMFTGGSSLSQRVISSHLVCAGLIISQTDVWEMVCRVELQQEMSHLSAVMTERSI